MKPRPSRFPKLVCLLKWGRRSVLRIAFVAISFYLSTVFYLSSVIDSKRADHEIIHNHAAAKVSPFIAYEPAAAAAAAATAAVSVSAHKSMLSSAEQRVLPITAYLEQPILNSRGFPFNSTKARSFQQRNTQPGPLQKIVYNRHKLTCSSLQASLPVDHPGNLDTKFGGTSGKFPTSLYENREEYAKCCSPVDSDPWLPWIHDMFVQGQHVEFVAHNRRRCRTDPKQSMVDMLNLEPQVALLQSVPIKRVYPHSAGNPQSQAQPRYKLSTLEDADKDGKETRFICRFHHLEQRVGRYTSTILGETLSEYPYNYESTQARRPGKSPILSYPDDELSAGTAHNDHVWNSILHFRCPIPESLQAKLAGSVVNDIPSIYVDVVPIRTPVRLLRSGYFPQNSTDRTFDPYKEWDMENLLPYIESSGRWENLPLCPISDLASETKHDIDISNLNTSKQAHNVSISQSQKRSTPQYNLVACSWTSATSQPRGNAHIDDSNADRLLEWLVYQLYIANFDHIYVYDNSAAQDNAGNSSLADIINLFPTNRVSRIDWPHRICNNNRPMHQNPGERSSQYAAETSCRLRYGPSTKWMAFFDIDEYFIPTSKWKDLQDWLSNGVNEESKILSFFQTRAIPKINCMDPYYSTVTGSPEQRACGDSISNSRCLKKRTNTTFLEAYNCDYTRLPKPPYAHRAKKQIYQPAFVLNHFVHYSTVTQRALDFPDERVFNYVQRSPYERRVNELTEAFMLHAKTAFPVSTQGWKEKCSTADSLAKNQCPVGIPFDEFSASPLKGGSDVGIHNCFPHQRIYELVAVLETKLRTFKETS